MTGTHSLHRSLHLASIVKDGDENMRKVCAQSNGTSIGMHHYLHDYLGNEQVCV
jgi:hypothetical protein